jgi:hypothetical protein
MAGCKGEALRRALAVLAGCALAGLLSAAQAQATKPDRIYDAEPPKRPQQHERRKPEQKGAAQREPRVTEPSRPPRTDIQPDRIRKPPPATSAPSPAEQYQRQQAEQSRRQHEQGRTQQKAPQERRVVQCRARPVCGGGGYGVCNSVQQTYTGGTLESGRQDIVAECRQANTPDQCNCAAQCSRVAQCSIF